MPPTLILETEPATRLVDHRGSLTKVWPRPVQGEVYLVELRPGEPRGHHLHPHGGEWFVPVLGRAYLVVVAPRSGARAEVLLDARRPVRIRVEAGQAHALFAVDDPTMVLAVADLPHPREGTEPFAVSPPAGLGRPR